MSFRAWVTSITFILLSFLIYFGRNEIFQVWNLLGSIDLWTLSLLIPIQLVSYYAVGCTIFSYLRAKGELKDVSSWTTMRIALELNFVNHILPSGGVSGFSYLGWLLGRHKVSAARSTMAQMIRFAMFFLAFVGILVIAVILLALDHGVNRNVIAPSLILVITIITSLFLSIYVIEEKSHLVTFSNWLARTANRFIRIVTFGKKRKIVDHEKIEKFFMELHQDYLEIKRDKKILYKPFLWSVVANIMDVSLIAIAFLSLGVWVSPAVIFIAFGIASLSSIISVTPGGAGVYEAVMVAFLASSGIDIDVAIAGTLIARVVLLLGTIVFGYVFYQLTIMRYGKKKIAE